MIRSIRVAHTGGGLTPRMDLGQTMAPPAGSPPPSVPTVPVDPWPFIIAGSVVIGGILYTIFGHKKMSWDKFFY